MGKNMYCNNKIEEILTTAVEFNSETNTLTYTIPELITGKAYNIIFQQPMPTNTTVGSSLVVSDGTNSYGVYTRKGAILTSGRVYNKDGIRIWFGGTELILRHFIRTTN